MLFLILSILSSSAIALVMRLSSKKYGGSLWMLAINYVICSIMSAIWAGSPLPPLAEPGTLITLGLGLLGGLFYLTSFMLMQYNTKKNGIVLASIFMKLGLLVPMVMSVLFFHEVPTVLQILGFSIAMVSILLFNLKKGSRLSGSFSASLLLLLLLGGAADGMAKVFEAVGPAALSDHFLLLIFLTALVLCLLLILKKKERPDVQVLLYGVARGVPKFFAAKFLLTALDTVPAVVAYPSFSVGTMLITTLMGILFFKERLDKRQWIAFVGVIAALVLLNI